MVEVDFFLGGKLINSFGGFGGEGEGGVVGGVAESTVGVDDGDSIVGFGGGLGGGVAERNFIFGAVRHELNINS